MDFFRNITLNLHATGPAAVHRLDHIDGRARGVG